LTYKKFDIDTWNRRDSFLFFKEYDDPFFNLTTHLDVTKLYHYCKDQELSFFLTCLYYSLAVANQITEFRLRFLEGEVVLFDRIDAGSTIMNADSETFSFCYFDYHKERSFFIAEGRKKINLQKERAILQEQKNKLNLIYYSTIPWVHFTSIKHARRFNNQESIPKIAFGKIDKSTPVFKLPISIEVNHALMDGFHVGLYLERLQGVFNDVLI